MPEANDPPKHFEVAEDDVGRRLDRVVRKFLFDQSLGTIFAAIRRGDIRVNSRKVEGGYRIQLGDTISIPALLTPEPAAESSAAPAELPTWFRSSIVMENDNILAFDKPRGVLVHGSNSLDETVSVYLRQTRRSSLSFSPGPLHRLDRNTSGLVLFGKSVAGASRFSSLLRSRSVRKTYLALLEGNLERTQTWVDHLERDRLAHVSHRSTSGRAVKCVVAPLCTAGGATLALVTMESGFTHQIRAQAASNGFPLVGDGKYGARDRRQPYLLHALSIRLGYFDSVLGFRSLEAPLPESQEGRLEALFGARRLAAALDGV